MDNYSSAIEFEDLIEKTFEEEKLMGMVLGPFTIQEAAQACNCGPAQLCPGPLGAVQEADNSSFSAQVIQCFETGVGWLFLFYHRVVCLDVGSWA